MHGRGRAAFSGHPPPRSGGVAERPRGRAWTSNGGRVTSAHTAGRAGSATSAQRDTTRVPLATFHSVAPPADSPPSFKFSLSHGAAVYSRGWARPIAPFPAARRDADDPPPPISRRSAPSPCAAMSRGGQCSANVRPRQGDPYIRISHGGDDEGLAAAAAASVQHLPPRRRLTRPRPCAARTVGGGRGRVGGGRAVTTPRCRCGPKRRGDPYVGAPARWRRLPR